MITNTAEMNNQCICMCTLLEAMFLEYIPRSGIARSQKSASVVLWGIAKLPSNRAVLVCILTSNVLSYFLIFTNIVSREIVCFTSIISEEMIGEKHCFTSSQMENF